MNELSNIHTNKMIEAGDTEQARAVAQVQSAVVLAKRFPRDEKAALQKILNSCSIMSLAEESEYIFPKGKNDQGKDNIVRGPSIRLAEELARNWGNIVCGVTELARGNGVSECQAYAWDLQTNFRDEKRFQVRHWRDTKQGGYAISDERDIYELIANMGARRKRACILAIIPGDVQEAAVRQCDVTLATRGDVTPERIAKMVGDFEAYRVTKAMIEKRIQRNLDTITPALMVQLGKVYNSLKDGMSKAGDWFELEVDPETGEAQQHATRTDAVKATLRSHQAEREPFYSASSAIAAVKECKTLKALDRLADEIRKDFQDSGRELPVEVDGAIHDRRAALL